ncbi:1-acyl-sn-glycerol-3-phosphate acyltransferases [Stackebrandtia soli]
MTRGGGKDDAWYWGRKPGGDRRPFWLRVAAVIVKPTNMYMFRRDWRGMENIPLRGGLIFAVNHISHADPMPVAHYVYNSGRNPRFMAKDGVFRIPVAGKIIAATGQIPVFRGGADAVKSLHAAIDIVKDGQAVIIYPEGTNTRQPQHWPMRGRTGVARLALETGAPVIPITVWGPQNVVNPITKKKNFAPRRPVTIVAGPPIDLSRWEGASAAADVLQSMTDVVMLRLRDQLAEIRGEEPPPLFDPKAAQTPGKDE